MATLPVDTTLLLTPGPIPKSRAQNTVSPGVDGFKENIVDPIVTAIESVMAGDGIVMDGTAGQAGEVPLSDLKIVARTGASTKVFSNGEAWKLLNKASVFDYAATIDLPTDGAASAVAALNAAMAGGPRTILVDVPAGVVIDGPVLGRSGCELAFSAGTPVLMGPLGQFKAAGSWKEDYAATPLRLTSDLVAGVTTLPLDTALLGGGNVSLFLQTGDRLSLRSGTDFFETRVTSAGPSSVGIADPLPFDAPRQQADLSYTAVTRQVLLHLDVDVASGAVVIPVRTVELSRVGQYDYVMATDDTNSGAPSSPPPCRVEFAQVIGVQTDGANTVTLDRPLRRGLTTARNARLQVVSPCIGFRLDGANITFTAPPGSDRVDPFVQEYAVDCEFEGLRIGNADAYGSRGQMFRTYRSYRSGYRGVTGLRPKFRGAGEGHGWVCQESVECFLDKAELDRCNDGVVFQASTDCWADLVSSSEPQGQHVAFRSCDERGCWVGTLWTDRGGGAVSFGDPVNKAGGDSCYIDKLVSSNPTGAHSTYIAPFSRSGVRWFQTTGGTNLVQATDHPADASLVGVDNYILLGVASGIAVGNYPVLVDGGVNNGTARGQSGFWFREIKLRGCARGFYLRRCTQPILDACEVAAPIADGSESWIVRAQDAAQLKVKGCDFDGAVNLFNLTNCTNGRIYRNGYCNLTGGAEYSDGGGNTGLHGQNNTVIGFSLTGALPS
jgi:hypothetical protein